MGNNNGNNSLTLDCVDCKQRFSARMPASYVANLPTSSIVSSPHERTVNCPKCGRAYMWAIQAVNTQWGLMAIDDDVRRQIEGSNLIRLT